MVLPVVRNTGTVAGWDPFASLDDGVLTVQVCPRRPANDPAVSK